jgi:hypothetical protein
LQQKHRAHANDGRHDVTAGAILRVHDTAEPRNSVQHRKVAEQGRAKPPDRRRASKEEPEPIVERREQWRMRYMHTACSQWK